MRSDNSISDQLKLSLPDSPPVRRPFSSRVSPLVVFKSATTTYEGGSFGALTGQNQDTESSTVPGGQGGLYDFLFREQAPVQGRWISPDPAGLAAVNPANPQTWNRYAYVGNNPLSFTDPLGLDNDCGGPCTPFFIANGNCPILVTYHSEQGVGGTYDMPDFTPSCFGGGNHQGLRITIADVDDLHPHLKLQDWRTPANNPPASPPKNRPKPLSFWDKAGLIIACIAGMDPEFATPMGESPQPADSTDSTNTTMGQGPPTGPNKSGRSVPYGGSPEGPGGAAGGAAYGAGVGQCITNVFTAWPKQ